MTIEQAISKLKNMRMYMEIEDEKSETKFSEDDYTANDMAVQALEKQVPNKPKHIYIKHGKHTWKKDENGEIDDFAWDFGYHNGVICEVCGKTVCVYCNSNYMELNDCEEEYWNCPSCGEEVYRNAKYCDCGQRLDWSDSE